MSTKSMFEDVGEFHRKFDLPVAGDGPCRMPDHNTVEYRMNFLEEELEELRQAVANGSLTSACDALVDLAWVALGTLHYFRAPGDELWAEVRRANMEKCKWTDLPCTCFDRTGSLESQEACFRHGHKRGAAEAIRKPPGWQPPGILRVVAQHNLRIKRTYPPPAMAPQVRSGCVVRDVLQSEAPQPFHQTSDEAKPVEEPHPLGCSCPICAPDGDDSFDESD